MEGTVRVSVSISIISPEQYPNMDTDPAYEVRLPIYRMIIQDTVVKEYQIINVWYVKKDK